MGQISNWPHKVKKIPISCKFLLYIIDQFFSTLQSINNKEFNNIASNPKTITFITYALNYDQKNNYDKFQKHSIDIYTNAYNLIKSNDILNLPESVSTKLIRNIKILKKFLKIQKTNFKEDTVNTKINDEQTLYELIINSLLYLEKNKLEENKKKFFKFKESIESPENKFLSYNDLFNEINKEEKNDIKENEIIKELYDFCVWCFYSIKQKPDEKFKYIFDKCKELKSLEEENINTYNSLEKNKEVKTVRKRFRKYVGLKNISNTCYLNSVIQILFMIPEFRFLILSLNDGRAQIKGDLLDDDNMLHQLQKLFTNLLLTSEPFFAPKDFYLSLRDTNNNLFANLNGQKDSQEFFLYLCDKLETLIKPITEQQFLVNNCFGGKICHLSKCSNCNNVNKNYEDFKTLSLEVQGINSLEESLNNFIANEKIEDYNCSNCNNRVILNRESKISQLPNYLVIHLKRLVRNMENDKLEKINSRFEFPLILNMEKYFDKEQENKEIKYEYNLKGVNVHMGNTDDGHFISIIKGEKDEKWYEFNDTLIQEFDINNLEEEVFGGKDKYKTAYLLFYEKKEKQPIIKVLNENEINLIKEKNASDIIEKSLGENHNIFEADKTYLDTKEKIYFEFRKWDMDIYQKNIPKEYFLEIFNNSKIYLQLLENSEIYKFDNTFIKILLSILKDQPFNINDLNNEIYESLFKILLNVILSYYYQTNDNEREEKENNIIFIIDKIIKPIIEKQIKEKNQIKNLIDLIYEILFTKDNLIAVFSQGAVINEEITNQIYSLINIVIKNSNQENNKKLFRNLNNIINGNNEEKQNSFYIYQIVFNMLKDKIFDKKNLENAANLFMPLFHKISGEKNENNLKNITEILRYLIQEDNIVTEDEIQEIKLVMNLDLVISLFDINVDFLSLLIQKLQFNDIKFSESFNTNYIMKLFTHCEKIDTKEKKIKFKLLKFIISLLEIVDKYTYNRLHTLMGFSSLVFQGPLNFGVSLMNNDIKTEIFEYISYNHIKKERCILAQLFPSKYIYNNDKYNLYLEEEDRIKLIYEIINVCFGLEGEKKGNYFLFKFLYLMQARSINYENLYQEMKFILENNKYDFSKFSSIENKLIEIVKYEKENLDYIIILATAGLNAADFKQKKYKVKPELPESFEKCKEFMDETINIDFYGTIVDMVPFQTQRILINLIASNDNLSLFQFEYFTNYFTKKELLTFNEEEKQFSFEFIKRDINEERINEADYSKFDYNDFIEKTDFNKFLKVIEPQLIGGKGISIINNSIDEDTAKKSIIRYFVLCKKRNTILKFNYSTQEIQKDAEKCFYLPYMILDSVEKEKDTNSINIHRTMQNFGFLGDKNFGISLGNVNYEKYFKEYLN